MLGRRRADGFFVGLLVIVPTGTLAQIAKLEFPVLRRIVDTLKQPLLLLCRREVQIEFKDDGAILRQVLLEPVYLLEPLLPEFFVYLFIESTPGIRSFNTRSGCTRVINTFS